MTNNNKSFERIMNTVKDGKPIYILPYKEPKVWGVGGIGEYWYGAEKEGKSSIAVSGEDKCPLSDIVDSDPGMFLGEEVVRRFGEQLPLVKILTPESRLSVQFHDAKNELWVVTGTDELVSGEKPWIIVGFSEASVTEYGSEVTEYYQKALKHYGDKLNALIDILLKEGFETVLNETKNVEIAARSIIEDQNVDSSFVETSLNELENAQKEVDTFYNRQYVSIGDVIPIPSGTLHALGPGIEVVEPQIAGPTQSLEDGATYPVRYAFPDYPTSSAKKMLDIDRTGEMHPEVVVKKDPFVIEKTDSVIIEQMPGGFEDKGLEVHRITLLKDAKVEIPNINSFHNLVAIEGNAFIKTSGVKYNLPNAVPGKEMLMVPVSARAFGIISSGRSVILDTFTPV